MRLTIAASCLLLLACSDPSAPRDVAGTPRKAATRNVQLLEYRGGAVVPTAGIQNIYWGPGWLDPAWVGDKIAGLDSFAAGFGGSRYAGASNEYGGVNGAMTSVLTYMGSLIDPSPVPKLSGKPTNDTQVIVDEVCQLNPTPPENYIANVYVDQRIRGGYCAFHGIGRCGRYPEVGPRVYVAFYWSLDATSAAACMVPNDSTGHSASLSALASFTGHELSETRTDPLPGAAWIDANGDENADKCRSVFPVPFVTLTNGSRWKLQALWSNAAYLATGTGCIPEAP